MAKKTETRVVRLKEIAQSLRNQKTAHARGYATGMVRAAYRLLDYALDLVPVDTGYLRSTAGVREKGEGFNKKTWVVFLAEYSIWVHERLDLAHGAAYNRKYAEEIAAGRKHLRRPQEQAKFIETPLRRHRKELLAVVKDSIRESGRQERKNGRRTRR